MRIIVGVLGVAFAGLGVRSMLMPRNMGETMGLSPVGTLGLNALRSVVGGFLLSSAALLVLGLVSGETIWFLAVAIPLGAAALGRVVGIVADGFDRTLLPPLVTEVAIGGVLVISHFILS